MVSRVFVKWMGPAMAAALLAGCTADGPRSGFAETDDAEPFNKAMHEVNIGLDSYVLRPVAQGYDVVTPTLIKHLIANGVSHLELPVDFANHLLQGDIDRSMDTLGRIVLNTMMGAGGLLDPATEFGLPRDENDFGLTLASWGVGEGTYLVLPLIGPSTLRDTAGFVVDMGFSPTTYIGQFTAMDGFGPTVTVLDNVDSRNRNADLIDDVLYNSEDAYVTLRAAYLQRRRALVAGEQGLEDRLPDIFDDESPQGGALPEGVPVITPEGTQTDAATE